METSGCGINTNSPDEKVTDHDLLIGLRKDVSWLIISNVNQDKIMTNHLAHHWIMFTGVLLALLTALGTLVLYILTTK